MKRSHLLHTSLVTSSAILMCVATISSAAAQTVPSTARPDVAERQLRIQETRPDVTGAPIVASPVTSIDGVEGALEFTLRSISFDGLGALSEDQIKLIYQDKVGEKISLNELNNIVNQITALYRNEGYILSRAVLPPQRISGGDVEVRIVEGFVNSVTLNGDVGSDSSVIHKYAAKIKASKPLNAKVLERYLLLMEDLPGVEARAVLAPSETTEFASDVIINITRKKFDASVNVDNRGSRFLGSVQAGVTVSANNLLNMDERTQVRAINTILDTEELKFGEIRHEQQLGSDGLKVIATASYVTTKPGSTLDTLNIEGTSTNFSLGLSYPIIRSRQSNWFVNAGLASKHTDVNSGGGNPFFEDTLRVASIGTSYDFLDKFAAVNRMEATLAQGFNLDTGRDNNQFRSRPTGETNFTKVSGQISRLQPISGPWSAFVAASGQYSKDALLSAEEFVIGGQAFGSAYDSAEITGDHGVATRAELQYSGAATYSFLSQYQLYGFYDIGKVWNRDIQAASETPHVSIASTGLGARFNVTSAISGSVEAAVPLTKTVSAFGVDGSAPRGFFSLQYRY